jgi:hypothetical protein
MKVSCARKNVNKLKYGLWKIHTFRSREESAKETETLEKEAVNIIKKTFPKEEKRQVSQRKGMRPDHDLLPEEIKAGYPENLNVYPEMRKLHERLKLMNTALACDRYPFLKELKTPDEKLRKNRAAYEYDSFTAAPAGSYPAGNASPGNAPSGAAGNAGLQYQAFEVVKKIQ